MTQKIRRLSAAIRKGSAIAPHRTERRYLDPGHRASDALGAAFLGEYRGGNGLMSAPEAVTGALLWQFPHLWCTIRAWPRLADEVEAEAPGLVPPVKKYSSLYRQAIHPSLFSVIAGLHDKFGWTKDEIAELLDRHGL